MTLQLMRLPCEIEYDGDDFTIKFTSEPDSMIGVIGCSSDSLVSLLDHEILKMEHAQYQGVSKSSVDGTDYGVHLGAIASFEGFHDLSAEALGSRKFQPWLGRVNNPHEVREFIERLNSGQNLSVAESNRMMLARRIPCENFAVFPLKPDEEFCMSGKRINGATVINRFYLYGIELPKEYDLDDRTDLPHWLGQALVLDNTAQVESNNTIVRWRGKSFANNALRMKQLMAIGHSNDGGAVVYDLDHAQSVDVKILDHDGTRLLPHYANERVPLNELATQILQQSDCTKELNLIVKYRGVFEMEISSTVQDFQKDIRLCFYGLIRPQDKITRELFDNA